jgi:hypothetical protein
MYDCRQFGCGQFWCRKENVTPLKHKIALKRPLMSGSTWVARFFLLHDIKNRKYAPNRHKISQMSIKCSKRLLYILAFFNLRPSKIYPNWDFWFENKQSGNPGFDNVLNFKIGRVAVVLIVAWLPKKIGGPNRLLISACHQYSLISTNLTQWNLLPENYCWNNVS